MKSPNCIYEGCERKPEMRLASENETHVLWLCEDCQAVRVVAKPFGKDKARYEAGLGRARQRLAALRLIGQKPKYFDIFKQ